MLDELLPEYVSDLSHNRYLTIQALHESYNKEHPDGYGYTQFKKSIREYQYSHNLSFHNTYISGEEMKIDFAGDALRLTDPKTGELTKVVVLVCILPYSGLGFAKAMYNVSMENFFGGISDAFSYFGGTTRIAKSDNMQQWVKKYDRYEPAFNDAFLKVRLERFFLAAIALLLGFQFHKGAIRTIMDFIYAMLLLHFNSIKVRLEPCSFIGGRFLVLDFNSIKVRLEQAKGEELLAALNHFNSIKVRLEPSLIPRIITSMRHFNSIKVRLELPPRAVAAPKARISIP